MTVDLQLSSQWIIHSPISLPLLSADMFYANTITPILWVSLGVMLFASLLILNFITASIIASIKTIGILRSLGARGKDIFWIFFIESMIIMGIIFVLSLIGV